MITSEQIEEWGAANKILDCVIAYKKEALSRMATATPTQYKYGQKIAIRPSYDFATLDTSPGTLTVSSTAQPGVSVQLLRELTSHDAPKISLFLSESWIPEPEQHQLTFLAQALLQEIILITVSKETSSPVILTVSASTPASVGIFVDVKPGASATIMLHKDASSRFIAETTRIAAATGSTLSFITSQTPSKSTSSFNLRHARTAADATVHWVDLSLGSEYTRSEIITSLSGAGSGTTNTVLYLATENQKLDIYTAALHLAAHTTSDSLTKGALMGTAKALSRGLVKINAHAPHSNGYEKQEALLLSDLAEADAIPYLEIDNPEVRCTHGSTIGQVDKEKLFYLMSRGLSNDEAHRKIIEGMFMPVLDKLDEPVRNQLHSTITRALQ